MANVFKSITSASITAPATVYTVPALTSTVVIGFHIANKHTTDITIDVQVSGVYIAKGVVVPVDTSFIPMEGKLVLETTETIIISPSVAAVSDAHISILEMT